MNSEKVKEIKEGLECLAGYKPCNLCSYHELAEMQETCCINVVAEEVIDYINELESENERLKIVFDIANEREYRKKFIDEWRKEYQKELDKQGNGHIAGFPDFDLVYKLYFEQKDRIAELEEYIKGNEQDAKAFVNGWHKDLETELKHFAERLKEKGKSNYDFFQCPTKENKVISISDIDETLKEFIDE